MSSSRSPRDWLLARHAHAEPQLETLRHTAIAAVTATPPKEPEDVSLTWRELILELVRPHRVFWRALAAVWLALAMFQVMRLTQRTSSPQTPPSNEALTAWLGQLKSHDTFAQINRRP